MRVEVESHHLLFQRTAWESGIHTRKLRQLPNLIIPMHTDIEDELHREVVTVPLLDPYTAQHTWSEFKPSRTYTGSIEGLLYAIEEATNHRKTTHLQKQLAELTVYAIQQQVPFIRWGQLTNEVGHGGSRLARR